MATEFDSVKTILSMDAYKHQTIKAAPRAPLILMAIHWVAGLAGLMDSL